MKIKQILEAKYHGANDTQRCPKCMGKGTRMHFSRNDAGDYEKQYEDCTVCKGAGSVSNERFAKYLRSQNDQAMYEAQYTGNRRKQKCRICDGVGKLPVTQQNKKVKYVECDVCAGTGMRTPRLYEARYHQQRSFTDVARAYKDERDSPNGDVFVYHFRVLQDTMITADIVVRDVTLSEERAKRAVEEYLNSRNLPYHKVFMPEQMRTYWKFTSLLKGPGTQ